MIIQALRLRARTPVGEVGVTMRFQDGLVLIRAAGGKGKSNAVLGIIYALGLEGMLGPARSAQLKHAMTDMVEVDGTDHPVVASDVLLELSNASGRTITILRTVKGERKPELVTVFAGAVLGSDLTGLHGTDYFVRLAGGATHEKGFHHFLAEFFGWALPNVLAYTGDSVPLYMESIFPLFVVEQMRGWSAIEGRFPTHLRIREPGVRAAEFLLQLDVHSVELRRALLQREIEAVRSAWTAGVRVLDTLAKQLGVMVSGLPSQPVSAWPPIERVDLVIARGEEWATVESYIQELRATLAQLPSGDEDLVQDVVPQLQPQLRAAEQRARDLEGWLAGVVREVDAAQDDLDRTETRIRAIDEDLVRNKDAKTLRRLGSTQSLSIATDTCPTCHQDVGLALLPAVRASDASPMSIEENIAYLEDQREMFTLIAAQTREAVEAGSRRLAAGQDELNAARATIRDLKAALVAHPKSLSTATIAERVRLENRIEGLNRGVRQAEDVILGFAGLSERWSAALETLKTLPATRLSPADLAKLDALQESFTSQVVEYQLASLSDPREIKIDPDTLHPEYQGFDLQFDLAGSDATRATWAYRSAFLEVARTAKTNHPGFLIFDEPQQQHPSDESYGAFLRRMARSRSFGQQVLVATNEETEKLRLLIGGVPYQLLDFGESRIMQPVRE